MSSELTEEYSNEEWWLEEGYADFNDVPVPDWHLAILEERMARYEKEDKSKWRTWDELEKELMDEILEEMKKRES